jgi:hypothetical protein
MKISKIILTVICVIIIYTYIFSPPFVFLPFGIDKPIALCSWAYLTYYSYWGDLLNRFKVEFLILFFIFIISVLINLTTNSNSNLLIYDFLLLIEVIPSAYFLVKVFNYKLSLKIEKILFLSATLAGLSTLYLVLNPLTAVFIKTEILKFPNELIEKFYYRGFGFSDGLFFSYPVIQGFCLSFVILGFNRNIRYIWLYLSSFLFFISIVTNARSGFFPIFVGVILSILFYPKWIIKFFVFSCILIFLTFGSISIFLEKSEVLGTSFEWASSTIDILSDLSKGEKTENIDVLFTDMIILPESIHDWILGSGEYLFSNEQKANTDIGYFLRLNYGGIIYLFLFLFLAFFMAKRLYSFNKILSLLMFISLIYLNFKSDFFIVNSVSRFFFLVYVVSLIDNTSFRFQNNQILN